MSDETEALALPGQPDKFIYRGDPHSALGLSFEEARVSSALGELPAWVVPGERATWVMLVHGRGATREEALRVLPLHLGSVSDPLLAG